MLPSKWDKEADVVVIGSGCGCTAAIAAANLGASVIILEKAGIIGGTVLMAAGGVAAAGTPVQKELGIQDSPEDYYNFLSKVGGIETDPELLRVYVDRNLDMFNWFTDYFGIQFPAVLLNKNAMYHPGLSDNSVSDLLTQETGYPTQPPRSHWAAGAHGKEFVDPFKNKIKELGIEVILNTPLKEFVFDCENNEVLGVKAEQAGVPYYVRAKKGVVVATGGAGFNLNLVQNLKGVYPVVKERTNVLRTPFITGDGIVAGMKIGAWFPGGVDITVESLPIPLVMGKGPLMFDVWETLPRVNVNKLGKRYVNETWYMGSQGDIQLLQPDRKAWVIFDETGRASVGWDPVERNLFVGNTIGEIAEKIGIPSAAVQETVNQYNQYVDSGVDLEFGRHKEFLSSFKKLETAPFYATELLHGYVGGYGPGLRINTKSQVINVEKEPIKRLYACGADSTGCLPSRYPCCGSALMTGFTFGRIAGENVVTEQPW
jgi:succinate dehydrogenase/fumarate reductase flavoprotein subunit